MSERLIGRAAPRTDPVCPLCRDDLGQEERWSCGGCQTGYHAACAWELAGCSTLGCPRKGMKPPPLRRRRTPAEIEATRQRVNAARGERGEQPLNAGLEERHAPAPAPAEMPKLGWADWVRSAFLLGLFPCILALSGRTKHQPPQPLTPLEIVLTCYMVLVILYVAVTSRRDKTEPKPPR